MIRFRERPGILSTVSVVSGISSFSWVDTAGIRRKGRVSQKVETYSVVAALKSIERADVALLVLDSSEMVTEQVMRIAGYVMDRARALVVVLSKWDLVDPHQLSQKKAERLVFEKLNFIDFAPLVTVSALKGDRMDRIFRLIQKVHAQYHRRINTSDLNSVMQLISQRAIPLLPNQVVPPKSIIPIRSVWHHLPLYS